MRAALALTLAICACDWDQASLLDALSIGAGQQYEHIDVYLAVDGVSREALDLAIERGAFADFHVSTLVPMYPATSDASWSRILHAPKIAGYEVTYFDPEIDQVMYPELEGLFGHVVPPAQRDGQFPYYRAFDMHGESYGDAVVAYADPSAAYASRLDNLFVTLGGRVGYTDTFTAYILELDVVAHGEGRESMVAMLMQLSERMAQFQKTHAEINVRFTLMSDHGSDHVAKTLAIGAAELLTGVGVTPVDTLDKGARTEGPWAIAEEHSRTTYGVAHTSPDLIETVAQAISSDSNIDLVIARADNPNVDFTATEWTGLFKNGQRLARFGYDAATNDVWLERTAEWATLGVQLPAGHEAWVRMSDEAVFAQTESGYYPDLVFRARTALLDVSVRYPAQIVYSLKEHAVMRGFQVPGSDSLGASGSHGAMGGSGSRGVLLSQARALPSTVRSDDVFALFPALQRHVETRFAQ